METGVVAMAVANGVMMQGFHWYSRGDGGHWIEVAQRADELARSGFTAVWLPPAYKGYAGAADVGYGVYDMYDLGEFDQKGSVRTKYGTRTDFLAAVAALRRAGLQVYADVVLNHRLGADQTELVRATPYANDNRRQPKGDRRILVGRPGRLALVPRSDGWPHVDLRCAAPFPVL
ncbi:MAG: alpha-amylase family glycosyl hydrolase [Pirellulales bacterium]